MFVLSLKPPPIEIVINPLYLIWIKSDKALSPCSSALKYPKNSRSVVAVDANEQQRQLLRTTTLDTGNAESLTFCTEATRSFLLGTCDSLAFGSSFFISSLKKQSSLTKLTHCWVENKALLFWWRSRHRKYFRQFVFLDLGL